MEFSSVWKCRRKNIYHVDRVLSETGELVDNGYHELYVNAEVDDGTTLAEYMKLMKSATAKYHEKFPRTSNAVRYYKQGEGRRKMCKVVDEYAKEYAEERTKGYAEDVVQFLMKSGVSDDIIQEATKLSLEEIAALKEKLVIS